MTAVALKGLASRKLRGVLTALAIVLGVAMISGSYVLTDSIQRAFHTIFTGSYAQTDAVVSGKQLVDWSSSGKATVPESLLARIRSLPDVDRAAGSIVNFNDDADTAKIIDKHGKAISGSGNPTFGFGIDGRYEQFSPMKIVDGRWASGPRDVVIDQATADKYGFHVGDPIRVAVGSTHGYRLSGIAAFGDVKSLGGATVAIFDIPTAQKLLHKRAAFDSISVSARKGVSTAALVSDLRGMLPKTAQVRTADQQAKADEKDITSFVSFIRYFLLAFGGVALFVGSFVILNTLSITVAQRTRELATLRTLGATPAQVLRSVVLEAFVLGVLASAVGLGLGVGLAHGLKAVFGALSLALPTSSLALEPRTIVVAMLAGVLLTVLASIVPAVRATRVAPIAAVREGANVRGSKPGRVSAVAATVLGTAAVALLGYGLFVHGIPAGKRVLVLVLGAVSLFVGLAALAPRLVGPVVAVLGRPSRRFGGAPGQLAVQNARRNPGRTAATAAALMIGLALVSFVSVFGKGLSSSAVRLVEQQTTADYVVTSQSGWNVFTPESEHALASARGVQLVSAVRSDQGRANGGSVTVNGVAPSIARVVDFTWVAGSDADVAALGPGEAVIKKSLATKKHLAVGSTLDVTAANGHKLHALVKGIYEDPKLDSLLGSVLLSRQTFDASFPRPRNAYVFVDVRGGASNGATESLRRALAGFPDTRVLDRHAFAVDRAKWLSQFMNLFYVLLALSVIVSLFGMVNTLALAVFERTRELGMLRAVGMTRRQARRMVRHESVLTASIGAALGIPLGIGIAAASIHALSRFGIGFTLPPQILVFVLVALVAGTTAAILPARRASRLNVLEALQYE